MNKERKFSMSQSIIERNLFSISVLMSAVLCTAAWAVPVEYRNPTDGRAWAAASADELVRWQWADGAVSAVVSASNVITHASASAVVGRGASPDGSSTIPLSSQEQQLLDVTVAQTDGSADVDTKTVRLLVSGESTVYVDAAERSFHDLEEPRVYGWSSLWDEDSREASAATLSTAAKSGAAIGSWTLPATGGYDVLDPRTHFGSPRRYTASLAFDDVVYWTCELRTGSAGLCVIIK